MYVKWISSTHNYSYYIFYAQLYLLIFFKSIELQSTTKKISPCHIFKVEFSCDLLLNWKRFESSHPKIFDKDYFICSKILIQLTILKIIKLNTLIWIWFQNEISLMQEFRWYLPLRLPVKEEKKTISWI